MRIVRCSAALFAAAALALAACSPNTQDAASPETIQTRPDAGPTPADVSTVCQWAAGSADSFTSNVKDQVADRWSVRNWTLIPGNDLEWWVAHGNTVGAIYNCTETRDLTVTDLTLEGSLWQHWHDTTLHWTQQTNNFNVNLQPTQSWHWLDASDGADDEGTQGTLTANLSSGDTVNGQVNAKWDEPDIGSNSGSCSVTGTDNIFCL